MVTVKTRYISYSMFSAFKGLSDLEVCSKLSIMYGEPVWSYRLV